MPAMKKIDSLTCRLDQQGHSIVRKIFRKRITENGLL